MTTAEKVGLMFHWSISLVRAAPEHPRRPEVLQEIRNLVLDQHVTHFNLRGAIKDDLTPRAAAEFLNEIQDLASSSRLAVPVTMSTDPRHGPSSQLGIRISSGYLSEWPEPLGLAAIGDAALVEEFAAVTRAEYRALGIHVALHPQADIATEPRWMRIGGTFGQDPRVVSELVAAYVRGLQGPTLGSDGVAAMVKHFPGGGPQRDGEDPHFAYGKDQVYPGGFFDLHIQPFKAAIAAGASQIMPYYGRPVGVGREEVGFAFNRDVISGILREDLGFDGIVCTDWGVLTDHAFEGGVLPAMAWGVEHLDVSQRIVKALEAGVDQFGGERCTDVLLELVDSGIVPEERIDTSARRLLREKARLGLFQESRVDPAQAEEIVGSVLVTRRGRRAQSKAAILLKNTCVGGEPLLPLTAASRCEVDGIDIEATQQFVEVVSSDPDAPRILRIAAPFEPRTEGFERFHHAGRLTFAPDELDDLLRRIGPRTVVLIEMDRPAIIPEILDRAGAVVAFCGASDKALLDVVFGLVRPEGALPFDLPRSMQAVQDHDSDMPGGMSNPLLPFGWSVDTTGWQPTSDDPEEMPCS
ncbi:beta-glucosidase [Marmoricola sp. URHA0025 HA25]